MLKDGIEKKINQKRTEKNNSSQPELTCQTRGLSHEAEITS
jgi:hypothetical protein